jgi:hypothetical protein
VASSSSAVSTAEAGRWTYLTTLPRMKTFLTELYNMVNMRIRGRSDHSYQMWVLELFDNTDIFKFDVQILINTFECAFDGDIIFELYCNFMVHQSFEKARLVSILLLPSIDAYLKNNIWRIKKGVSCCDFRSASRRVVFRQLTLGPIRWWPSR